MKRLLALTIQLRIVCIPLAFVIALAATFDTSFESKASAQDDVIPRGQSKPPNKPYSPEEAIEHMSIPDGFEVEVFAAEPQIVNPTAMAFDEQGRLWVTESFEYPRREPGPGRDRIKVLEDTDHDGRADKVTIFAEGLNIPCGIAIGHGGVWVSNSPDILFLQDTDGDLKADVKEVVVTGFGRDDTHELPNSLVWGPDGWLYGLNGVFNRSIVVQGDQRFEFTAAMFRIDPRTRKFELFAEGTSNPWGIAWNSEGEAFLSACVIDHLWHLTETGYYHRQAGAYPPYTWKIESIVDHKHQQAAYCGIHYLDSDAYPEPYRDILVMGNIHGNCINVDSLERNGSTYHGVGHADLLSANDAWFMPVAQKTGPDGCLYILDWYDRYHCYQDANRDPEGIDRLKGRVYRLRYKDTPRAKDFDLQNESVEELIARLHMHNDYFRSSAQRVLQERNDDASRQALEAVVLNPETPHKPKLHAFWSLMGRGPLDKAFQQKLFESSDSSLVAWAARAAGNDSETSNDTVETLKSLVDHDSADVRLQVAIASSKLLGNDAIPTLLAVLDESANDPLIPRIVWENLHPMLEGNSESFVDLITTKYADSAGVSIILSRSVDRILGVKGVEPATIGGLIEHLVAKRATHSNAASQCLNVLAKRIQSGEVSNEQLTELLERIQKPLKLVTRDEGNSAVGQQATLLLATCGQDVAIDHAAELLMKNDAATGLRIDAAMALIKGSQEKLLEVLPQALDTKSGDSNFRGSLLTSLGRVDDPQVAPLVLKSFESYEADVRPKAIELLTGRKEWSKELLAAVRDEVVPANSVNVNQLRKLLAFNDEELTKMVTENWGTVRVGRNPDREAVINQMRDLLSKKDGDPHAGAAVFKRVCGQCHKIYGEGYDVGPDITVNGRGSFDQLLSNVFDPSLVIGADYQARTVITLDGRVETGLLAEENDQRVVLRPQGGKEIVIARDDIDQLIVSELSLMPEDLEKQLKEEELVDLFAFLMLDKQPGNPKAKPIPGAPQK